MKRHSRVLPIAAGVIALSALPAAAAVVTNDLNLRQGPGTNYGVITSMPAGESVDVGGCTGNWCEVNWRGYAGYASASYLAGEGRAMRRAPRYSYRDRYEPAPRVWGYGYRDRPGVTFGLSIGDRWDRRRWRNRWY